MANYRQIMREITRTERGWTAHYICGNRCAFRRNTLLEMGETRIIISTVGCFYTGLDTNDRTLEKIGCNRHYETMVFHALYMFPYWDVDVYRSISHEAPWSLLLPEDPDEQFYYDAKANDMHEAVVDEMHERMLSGEEIPDNSLSDSNTGATKMPNITMCTNAQCPKCMDCYRFMASPSPQQS